MSLVLLQHLGLGDHILTNGMVRVLAKRHDKIKIPCKMHNAETAAWMFSDLENVSPFPIKDDTEARSYADHCEKAGHQVLRIGVHTGQPIPKDWDAWFYRQAGIPFECRWSEFRLPLTTHAFLGSHFAFIHDDPKRAYVIKNAPQQGYHPNPSVPFENHVLPLQTAEEIHVIDSCFLCLADSIETTAKRHVFHAYATAYDPYKKFGPPTLRKNWEILT